MNNELLNLIKENPTLPIYAWVYWEVVGDDCHSWLGQFGSACIREYANVEPYGYNEQTMVFKDEDEDYIQYLMENEFHDSGLYLTEEEAQSKADNLEYKKAIFVNIDLPNSI